MTHKELVHIAYRWVLNNTSCGIAFREIDCAGNGEVPDVIGFSSWCYSIVIECKLTRSDFLADQKKKFRIEHCKGMGKYRFYMCPSHLIMPHELPALWGLIYVNEKGKARLTVNPYGKLEKYHNSKLYPLRGNGFSCNIEAEHQLLYSALRRLHIRGRLEEIYQPLKEAGFNGSPII